ncbi:hypothetical protein BC937DRAFT_88401 [Endogone sp. FLAS-F59071]|nr:hypothetical protein BC937DRAFT_88401 [Endogone sp. FLAS-F59071]|eukprot:RUS18741.1 hypothetical protein BC937DRAFT_88401 [Endogone sp. FLAS-F59071]
MLYTKHILRDQRYYIISLVGRFSQCVLTFSALLILGGCLYFYMPMTRKPLKRNRLFRSGDMI